MSVWLAFQIGNGVSLDPATSDEVEIDTTGMSPCILAPPQCTSGATYMLWIKLHDTISGVVFTTLDWSSPREGIRFHLDANGKLHVAIFRVGPDLNRFTGTANGFHSNVHAWQHISVVWKTDPKFDVFLDGMSLSVSQGTAYSSSNHQTYEPRMRMFLGREYITRNTAVPTRNMTIDELKVFDRPLEEQEVMDCLI